MATHLRDSTSMQDAGDVCSAIASGLDSDSEAKHLAPLWDALTAKADELAAARRAAERALGRARAKVTVMDSIWDPETAAFGRDVVDQSGGKRDQAPYTRFFKNASPSATQDFGVDREVQQGKDWLAELARNPNEPLATKWTPRLSVATENLESAAGARRNAVRAVALQDTAEELFIADINREIDILEGELLTLFPGQPKRVAAFLEPTKPRHKRFRRKGDSSGEED
ncbi:MAG: hypothetical protein IPM54_21345 [Polyangiaceae bacterium]|nr:hypothetical protein [Polyangiaceae bacterium]